MIIDEAVLPALRLMLGEAIGTRSLIGTQHEDEATSEVVSAVIRCIGYTLGGTGPVAYDRAASGRWRALFDSLEAVVYAATPEPTQYRNADGFLQGWAKIQAVERALVMITDHVQASEDGGVTA